MSRPDLIFDNAAFTSDTLFDATLKCRQYREGYRFSIDAVLAAHFLRPVDNARILDIGTGCGIIPLILLYRHGTRLQTVDGLEIQQALVDLARANIEANGFSHMSTIFAGDIARVLSVIPAERYDHFLCNPPYYGQASGRKSSNPQAMAARHQLTAGIEEFARGAAAVVRNGGSGVFIYPAEQSCELFRALAIARLEPKRMQFVYSYQTDRQSARLVLVECRKNGGVGLEVLPPFYIYREKNGDYSKEMAELYALNPGSRAGSRNIQQPHAC